MALTYKASVIAKAMLSFLEDNKSSLGIDAVYYGDQDKIPTTPALCVEPGIKTREIVGIPYQTMNTIVINLLLYHTSLSGIREIQLECDEIAEEIEDSINIESIDGTALGTTGTRFGGIITAGQVTRLEHGYRIMSNKLMRANRLVWEGISKTRLVNTNG